MEKKASGGMEGSKDAKGIKVATSTPAQKTAPGRKTQLPQKM